MMDLTNVITTKVCGKCKISLSTDNFWNSTKKGKQVWCIKCCKEHRKTYKAPPVSKQARKRYKETYEGTSYGKYMKAVRASTRRGFSFTLSEQEFVTITSKPCHYCDGPLPRIGSGLDRIDNDKGYELGNVIPCCTRCNRTRNRYFTKEEMEMFIAPAIRAVMKQRASRV